MCAKCRCVQSTSYNLERGNTDKAGEDLLGAQPYPHSPVSNDDIYWCMHSKRYPKHFPVRTSSEPNLIRTVQCQSGIVHISPIDVSQRGLLRAQPHSDSPVLKWCQAHLCYRFHKCDLMDEIGVANRMTSQ